MVYGATYHGHVNADMLQQQDIASGLITLLSSLRPSTALGTEQKTKVVTAQSKVSF